MKQDKQSGSVREFIKQRKVDGGLILAGIVFGTLLNWNIVEIIFFAVFIWSIVGPLRSTWLTWPALFFLSFIPVLLLMDRYEQAEEFAIYAYYFLVMVVIRGIIEIHSESVEEESRYT